MNKEPRHAAIIEIDSKMLLKMLDFEGGTIHRIYQPEEIWNPNTVCIVLEHPDLDEVEDSFQLRKIVPTHQATYGNNGCIIKIERIDPPKKSKVKILG